MNASNSANRTGHSNRALATTATVPGSDRLVPGSIATGHYEKPHQINTKQPTVTGSDRFPLLAQLFDRYLGSKVKRARSGTYEKPVKPVTPRTVKQVPR